jgi:uncharacterized tellurite resistance protein B-like protein
MEYSHNQKLAIAKILLEIGSVDEKIDSREMFYFEKVKEELELSAQDHYDLANLSTLRCLSMIKNMDDEQKKTFAQMMKKMILADEYIDPNEATSFYDICDFAKINDIGLTLTNN